ncbi:hypothetical protein [Selenomonas artemidis]|jgi:hypothetical protein|uniref:hypothetical protein n=1 Tax=Selenomonas artemidis TaxID=671224 RepID=UPI0028E97641|nr:hypothetical protein [Selenomonas artemidis]
MSRSTEIDFKTYQTVDAALREFDSSRWSKSFDQVDYLFGRLEKSLKEEGIARTPAVEKVSDLLEEIEGRMKEIERLMPRLKGDIHETAISIDYDHANASAKNVDSATGDAMKKTA